MSSISSGQEVLNERYDINYLSCIFGSVIATDSCYYVTGQGSNQFSNSSYEGAFLKFNFDGSINIQQMHNNDTIGIDLWESPNLIKTLDGNFAQIGTAWGTTAGIGTRYVFLKFAPNGDTLQTVLIDEFYFQNNDSGIQPSIFFQNADSTYIGVARIENLNTYNGGAVVFKLSKNGDVLWHNTFYGIGSGLNAFTVLLPKSLVNYDTNKIVIGASIISNSVGYEDFRAHIKLITVDTLGNLLISKTFWEDSVNLYCMGLTKTYDNGLLYCGQYGRYFDGPNAINYKGHITKLDANFDEEWRLLLGGAWSDWVLRNITVINDTQFVAVGDAYVDNNNSGWLVKFNINGEVLWERNYYKVPRYENELGTIPKHELYDVDLTMDSGFVMVGQSTNYYQNVADAYGQQGWLLKVDKYGCLVPNCQQYDNIDTTDTTDTVVVEPIITTELYPNPANTNLYYYHTQISSDSTQNYWAYLFNMQGQRVQQFELSQNNMTYIMDVTNFASGTYVFKVVSQNGHILKTKKVIVQH